MQILIPRPPIRSTLLQQAVGYWDARVYDSATDSLLNLVSSGVGNARFGNSVGVDTADPVRLPFTGERYVYFPNTSNNNVTVPLTDDTYDFTVTYLDNTQATATVVASGGIATFGNTMTQFGLKSVKLIVVSKTAVEVARFVSSGATQTQYVDTLNSKTWTVNRATSGPKTVVVDRPLLLNFASKYLEVANHALLNFGANDSLSIVFAGRHHGTPTANEVFVTKTTGNAVDGWEIRHSSATLSSLMLISGTGGIASIGSAQAYTSSVAFLASGSRSGDAPKKVIAAIDGVRNTGDDNTTTNPTNTLALRIGLRTNASLQLDGEIFAAAVFRRVLSSSELAQLKLEMGAH